MASAATAPVVATTASSVVRRIPFARVPQALRQKLPLNVLLVDGQCNMAVGHMVHALERNYSFSATDEAKNSDLMLKNTIFFGSINTPDSKELTRFTVGVLESAADGAAKHGKKKAKRGGEGGVKDSPLSPSAFVAEVPSFLMFLEQVPSAQAEMRRKRHGGASDRMFTASDGRSRDQTAAVNDTDLLITTGGAAFVRVMTHLDRPHLSATGRALWAACPLAAMRLWAMRQERLMFYHGRQPADVFLNPSQLRGLQERVWSARGVGSGKVRKPIDVSKIFSDY